MDYDNIGWTLDRRSDGSRFRFRVHLDRVDSIFDKERAILDRARRREMSLHEYVAWVAGMLNQQLHLYRDQVRRGEFDAALYEAWLHARLVVREEEYWVEGAPGFWLKDD